MDKKSPYHILGIRVGATEKEIRRAYLRLAMKHHPDRNPEDPGAEEKFKEVQWAYETLLGGNTTRESHHIPAYRWGFDDPFSDFSHPFFNFYMLAKKFFFSDQDTKPPLKKRGGKGNKR
jgi:DnaJ-class molecular chaperone